MYVNGTEKSPIRKESEKLRVAREERNIPRRSSAKDFMSVYCWVVGWKEVVSVWERINGRRVERAANMMKTDGSIYDAC